MDLQLILPTIHEDLVYQEDEEVQEKYFGRAQNKIVQGMTAKERIPGKLGSFNIRKKVDIMAVKSLSISITEKDEEDDEGRELEHTTVEKETTAEKQNRASAGIQRERIMKSFSLSMIEEDEEQNDELEEEETTAEKQNRASVGIQRERIMKSFSLSMIEEDEEHNNELEEEEPVQLLNVSGKQEARFGSYAKDIERTRFERHEMKLSNENTPYRMNPDLGIMGSKENLGAREDLKEECGKSKVHKLEEELMKLEEEIKEKSEFLSVNAEKTLTEQDYRNLLRELYENSMMRSTDLPLENGKGQRGQGKESVTVQLQGQSGVHEGKLGDNKDDGKQDGHKVQKKNRKARKIPKNERAIDSKTPKMNATTLIQETCLKESGNSFHRSDVKSSAEEHKVTRQKQTNKKVKRTAAELFPESPYAESMRYKGTNLPRIKPSSIVKGEPIFPAPQKRNVCKLPPIQGLAKVSRSAVYTPSDSNQSIPLTKAPPTLRPRSQNRPTTGPPPACPAPRQGPPSQTRSLLKTPTSTPSTPKITPPLMSIPKTSREIRNCLQAPKRQTVTGKVSVGYSCNILIVDHGRQLGRNSSNNCAPNGEVGADCPPLKRFTAKSLSQHAENKVVMNEVAVGGSRESSGKAEKIRVGRRHGQQ